jgi:hypothetical protein
MSRKIFEQFVAGNKRGWRQQKNPKEAKEEQHVYIKNGLSGWRIVISPKNNVITLEYYDPPKKKWLKEAETIPPEGWSGYDLNYWHIAESYHHPEDHRRLIKDLDNLEFHDYPPYFRRAGIQEP